MAAAKPVLGYWDIRGLVREALVAPRQHNRPDAASKQAQPIRLLLAHAGIDYEDRLYTVAVTANGCAA